MAAIEERIAAYPKPQLLGLIASLEIERDEAKSRLSAKIGAPREIRTPDHLVRSQVLYPAELWAHSPQYTSTSAYGPGCRQYVVGV